MHVFQHDPFFTICVQVQSATEVLYIVLIQILQVKKAHKTHSYYIFHRGRHNRTFAVDAGCCFKTHSIDSSTNFYFTFHNFLQFSLHLQHLYLFQCVHVYRTFSSLFIHPISMYNETVSKFSIIREKGCAYAHSHGAHKEIY